ncbi:hypothetical protein GCM10027449_05900 [Sinomonas notoginsengisoli]|uniref:hypothetical protein n=1 Tax=Sinomonas notoginsengisoli TaxID=1457311 RepID=UPI001F1A6D95|nr:hypothetical protein [Sinomonas notoginsengisoli]
MNELAEAWSSGPIRIHFEGIGTVTLPPVDTLAFLGGAALLAAVGLIEWPLAVLVVVARLLALTRRSAGLRGLGDALALVR